MPYVQQAIFAEVGEFGIHFITISIFLFAFSSLIGNYCYAESNFKFIIDNKKAVVEQINIVSIKTEMVCTKPCFQDEKHLRLLHRIGIISSKVVPVMAILYILLGLYKPLAILISYQKYLVIFLIKHLILKRLQEDLPALV